MKIAICSSLDFVDKIKIVADKLVAMGHEVMLPQTAEKIYMGEISYEKVMEEKSNGEIVNRGIRQDSLKYYFGKINEAGAILVLNYKKKEIEGYIGGAVFLEMGFAHVLGKKIFLLKNIPKMQYSDEVKMMQPVVIEENFELIK